LYPTLSSSEKKCDRKNIYFPITKIKMSKYKILKKQVLVNGTYSIVPIRYEDRLLIMQWRNEQIYHLRQNKLLTEEDQDLYFYNIVGKLFDEEQPSQILFSYLDNNVCIGYGGLVHINWIDKNAEISFIVDTKLEKTSFAFHWDNFLALVEQLAFEELSLKKIFTYAFDIRPNLYPILEKAGYFKDAQLKNHCLFNGTLLDVVIHAKLSQPYTLRKANLNDQQLTYNWASDPYLRMYSFDQTKIEFETHQNWFLNKISDNSCKYYIFQVNKTNIGSVRFDIDADGVGIISYLVDKNFHGKGYGEIILKMGMDTVAAENKSLSFFSGYVLNENKASIRIFKKLGFNQFKKDPQKSFFLKKVEIENH
jgi:RimJ/RimL family protein N-acetyltransferase